MLMDFDVLASEAGWVTTKVTEVGSQPYFRLTPSLADGGPGS
jgi:hypothetical protein